MKKTTLLLIGICLFFIGCAHAPLPTAKLSGNITAAGNTSNLHFTFIDARSNQFKTEDAIILQTVFPTVYSCGDLVFDAPLNSAFEKMFLIAFPDNQDGCKAEIKLVKFYFTWKLNELTVIPFIGLLAAFADVEYHGIVKMEVAVLDKDEKFIFTKIYEADVKEMKTPGDTPVYEEGFDILRKAISKVMAEFETDTKRIKFN